MRISVRHKIIGYNNIRFFLAGESVCLREASDAYNMSIPHLLSLLEKKTPIVGSSSTRSARRRLRISAPTLGTSSSVILSAMRG